MSASKRSALEATPRKVSQLRPYATRKWRTPTVEARSANPIACAMCGEPVLKRRRPSSMLLQTTSARVHEAVGGARSDASSVPYGTVTMG